MDWYLESAKVINEKVGEQCVCECNNWLSQRSEDKKTYRKLEVSSSIPFLPTLSKSIFGIDLFLFRFLIIKK